MDALPEAIDHGVDQTLLPALFEFIKVPSCTPTCDPEWETNGLLEQAQKVATDFLDSLGLAGYKHKVLKEAGRPPLFVGEVEATDPSKGTVIIYGHFDKQPPLTEGWLEGTGPYTPVLRDGLLFGRAAIDDGYAIMSAGLLVKTLQTLGLPRGMLLSG